MSERPDVNEQGWPRIATITFTNTRFVHSRLARFILRHAFGIIVVPA